MKHHEVIQNSPEWDALRLNYKTASEAPVIMASSKNMKRDELLEAKATQTPREFSSFVTDVIFDRGHETEAMARPLVEEMIGEELFPVTGSNGLYLASFDGLNMLDTISFEHKQWNVELAGMVKAGRLPDFIRWQLEHQLLVCESLQKIIFVVSDGTPNKFVHLEYVSDPAYRSRLIDGWKQFHDDLLKFKPAEKKAEPTGQTPQSLPVLVVDIAGQLTTEGNLEEFKKKSLELIEGIKTELVTDQDFADAALTIKMLKEGEQQIELIKEQLLNKTAPLKIIFTALDEIKGRMAPTRIALNKQADAQKKNRKNSIVQAGMDEVNEYIVEVNKEFEANGIQVIGISTDLYGCIKGMSSFDNMQSAVNDEVARFKIECNQRATTARNALAILNEMAADYLFLFQDMQDLAFMDVSHLKLTIDKRISDYKLEAQATEQKRIAGCKEVIETLKRAANPPLDTVTLAHLETVKNSVLQINTADLKGFEEEAAREKTNALQVLDGLIADKNAELTAEKVVEDAAADTPQQTVSHQAIGERESTEIPIHSKSSGAIEDVLPGHDDLAVAEAELIADESYAMRDAIKTVLDGSLLPDGLNRNDDGLQHAISFGHSPTLETAERWATILRKVL